jgi:hypothetical protein
MFCQNVVKRWRIAAELVFFIGAVALKLEALLRVFVSCNLQHNRKISYIWKDNDPAIRVHD